MPPVPQWLTLDEAPGIRNAVLGMANNELRDLNTIHAGEVLGPPGGEIERELLEALSHRYTDREGLLNAFGTWWCKNRGNVSGILEEYFYQNPQMRPNGNIVASGNVGAMVPTNADASADSVNQQQQTAGVAHLGNLLYGHNGQVNGLMPARGHGGAHNANGSEEEHGNQGGGQLFAGMAGVALSDNAIPAYLSHIQLPRNLSVNAAARLVMENHELLQRMLRRINQYQDQHRYQLQQMFQQCVQQQVQQLLEAHRAQMEQAQERQAHQMALQMAQQVAGQNQGNVVINIGNGNATYFNGPPAPAAAAAAAAAAANVSAGGNADTNAGGNGEANAGENADAGAPISRDDIQSAVKDAVAEALKERFGDDSAEAANGFATPAGQKKNAAEGEAATDVKEAATEVKKATKILYEILDNLKKHKGGSDEVSIGSGGDISPLSSPSTIGPAKPRRISFGNGGKNPMSIEMLEKRMKSLPRNLRYVLEDEVLIGNAEGLAKAKMHLSDKFLDEQWPVGIKVSSLQDKAAMQAVIELMIRENPRLAMDTAIVVVSNPTDASPHPWPDAVVTARCHLEGDGDDSTKMSYAEHSFVLEASGPFLHRNASKYFPKALPLPLLFSIELCVETDSRLVTETSLEFLVRGEDVAAGILSQAINLLRDIEAADQVFSAFTLSGQETRDVIEDINCKNSVALPVDLSLFLDNTAASSVKFSGVCLSKQQIESAVFSCANTFLFDNVHFPPLNQNGENVLLGALASRQSPADITLSNLALEAGIIPTFDSGQVEGIHATVALRVKAIEKLALLVREGKIRCIEFDYAVTSRKEVIAVKEMREMATSTECITFGPNFKVEVEALHKDADGFSWTIDEFKQYLDSPVESDGGCETSAVCLPEWVGPLAVTTNKPCGLCKEGHLCHRHKHKLAH